VPSRTILIAISVSYRMPARKRPSAANPDLLMDLVAANRILAMEGVLDAYGHVSVRSDRKPAISTCRARSPRSS
jgi:hypothetical protein